MTIPALSKTTKDQRYEWIGEMDFRASVPPGMYIGQGEPKEYTIEGITVQGLNYLHAEHMAYKELLRRSGSAYPEHDKCDRCGSLLQYVIVMRGLEDGRNIAVGQDCALLLESNFSIAEYNREMKLRDIQQSKKNGQFYHSREIDYNSGWIWTLWKSPKRPAWMRLSKFDAVHGRGRNARREPTWYMFVWGETKEEVFFHLGELKDLQKEIK